MEENNKQLNRGSQWRKWDLHVHTPDTKLNYGGYEMKDGSDKWDLFCEEIESSDVSVIGITDYFSVENYFIFIEKFKEKYPQSKKKFFPNIEFRLEVSVNKKAEEVNLHIIFSDKVEGNKIQTFLSKLNTNIKDKNGACISCKDIVTEEGYEKAGIDHKILRDKLKENFGDDNCYLVFAASSRPDNKCPRKLNITDNIDKICDGFFGGKQNVDFYLNEGRYENGEIAKKKPVISGCDAHSFKDLYQKLGKSFERKDDKGSTVDYSEVTWIKADPTFEGLRQIVYEPEGRVFIGEEKPVESPSFISSLSLNISSDAKIGKDKFCFSGIKCSYGLSPYFNCFIGGRGSGKSTILNFLGLRSVRPNSSSVFWYGDNDRNKEGLRPDFDPESDAIFSFEGTEIFEFFSQDEIEGFAKDGVQFTQAIFDRIGNSLGEFEKKTEYLQTNLDGIVSAVIDLKRCQKEKEMREREKNELERIVAVLKSEEYTKYNHEIGEKTQVLGVLRGWKAKVDDLKGVLSKIASQTNSVPETKGDETVYQKSFTQALRKINEAIEILGTDFSEEAEKERILGEKVLSLEVKIEDLVKSVGYASENAEKIKSAPQKITRLKEEIENFDVQIEANKKIIGMREGISGELKENEKNHRNGIESALNPLKEMLLEQVDGSNGGDLKEISLEYFFDEEKALSSLAEEFYDHFKGEYGDKESGKRVCEFIRKNKEVFKGSIEGIKELLAKPDKSKDGNGEEVKYLKFLERIFVDINNHDIFLAIRDKHLYDVKSYKRIQVRYDGRDIEKVSFGQRCTAVIVILLLFGTSPLIIDEPEAHLDSLLIANYLVPLIKKEKSKRQIIFATHNANFVINGDAEKIFILENNFGKTNIIETTIESMKHRQKLLKLEGGKEAFRKRGEKLNI